jgi:prevent-host-death family protein
MKVATQHEVAANFAEYLKATWKGPVVVISKGKPVVVLLRAEDQEDLERLLMGHSANHKSILEPLESAFETGARHSSSDVLARS